MLNSCKSFQPILSRIIKPFTFRTLKNPNTNKITVLILPPKHKDYNDILKFMSKEFIPNEPTCKSLGVSSCSIMSDRFLLGLSQGYSLIAKNQNTGKIMGVAVNEKTSPWDADLTEKMAHSVQCPNLQKLLRFYAFLTKAPKVFEKYNVHEVFEVAYLGVAKGSQKLGIATKLVEESQKMAKRKGFKILRIDATNFYTARICEKLNMEFIYEIAYDTYLDANRKPVLEVQHPHTKAKVFVLKLDEKSKIDETTKK